MIVFHNITIRDKIKLDFLGQETIFGRLYDFDPILSEGFDPQGVHSI